jgi:hypothetical protein
MKRLTGVLCALSCLAFAATVSAQAADPGSRGARPCRPS